MLIAGHPSPYLTCEQFARVVASVTYKDWRPSFKPAYDVDDVLLGYLFQWSFGAPDNMSDDKTRVFECCSRQWFIPVTADRTDVINTLWLAVEIAERHEFMEQFRVAGQVLRNPHARIPEGGTP